MKAVFVDTAGWMMLADGADRHHGEARAFRDRWIEQRGFFASTDFVMNETLTLIRSPLGLAAAESW